jgi:hypothetical protein
MSGQAEALVAAARTGVPFCQKCADAAAARAASAQAAALKSASNAGAAFASKCPA